MEYEMNRADKELSLWNWMKSISITIA